MLQHHIVVQNEDTTHKKTKILCFSTLMYNILTNTCIPPTTSCVYLLSTATIGFHD